MPTLLTRKQAVEDLVARLEIHYLANPVGNLHFRLLSDWADAVSEELPNDQELLHHAREGMAEPESALRPVPGGGDRFLLFIAGGCGMRAKARGWVGWERKRGKLEELNRLLRGAKDTTFSEWRSKHWTGSHVRYVITLDADTRLAPGVAYRRGSMHTHCTSRSSREALTRGGRLRNNAATHYANTADRR